MVSTHFFKLFWQNKVFTSANFQFPKFSEKTRHFKVFLETRFCPDILIPSLLYTNSCSPVKCIPLYYIIHTRYVKLFFYFIVSLFCSSSLSLCLEFYSYAVQKFTARKYCTKLSE